MKLEELDIVLSLEDNLITCARQSVVMVSLALALLAFFFVERHASIMTTPLSMAVMILAFVLILGAILILLLALRSFSARIDFLPVDVKERERRHTIPLVTIFGLTIVALVGFALILGYMGYVRIKKT